MMTYPCVEKSIKIRVIMLEIKNLKNKNRNSNIWMFHRIKTITNHISDIYKDRGMVHEIEELFCLIDKALSEGYKFGSISEAIECSNTIHLTFDDGYKEHLFIAKELKNRYGLEYGHITFSINVRNSFYPDKLCMDIVYQLMDNNELNKLNAPLGININHTNLDEIKKILFSTTKYIEEINKYVDMNHYFLNEEELVELSKLFSISSHCINHCFLTSLSESEVYMELLKSKEYLSAVLNTQVNTICFPDGKHSKEINNIAKRVGYKYGLAIAPKMKEPIEYNLARCIP